MNKTLLHLITAFALAFAALPGITHAAPDGGDFVALQVPDLRKAITFFHDVLNCDTLSRSDGASMDSVALLECGRQTVIELTQALATHGLSTATTQNERITLNTDNATNVAAWLRANRIRLLGKPVRIADGSDAGKIAVSFLTPWGQPLELVSRVSASDLLGAGTASAADVAAQ